ncbi:MAG: tRNA-dihydrouridine synthase family protein [Bacteroidales bacterium]
MTNWKDIQWVLAPMDGFTDYRYRNTLSEVFGPLSGIRYAVAPFVSLVAGKKVKRSHLKDLLPENNLMIVEPQFLGNEEDYFPAMANALNDLGYSCMNWNLGCPMKAVASKQRGSGLLMVPDRIERFLDKVLPTSPIKLSIKIRLGYLKVEESLRVVEVLNQYPLEYVAVHPRLGIQLYNGKVDLDKFACLQSLIKTHCVYNGDIFTVEDAQKIHQRFPEIKTMMLGRGVIANPFLPSILQGRIFSQGECLKIFSLFLDVLLENHLKDGSPERLILHRQKQFWSNFAIPYIPPNLLDRIKKVSNIQEYRSLCNEIE